MQTDFGVKFLKRISFWTCNFGVSQKKKKKQQKSIKRKRKKDGRKRKNGKKRKKTEKIGNDIVPATPFVKFRLLSSKKKKTFFLR